MTGKGRFAKGLLGVGALQHPLRRLHVHSFDHLIAEALGAAVEGRHKSSCPLDLGRGRRESLVARGDLIGVDEALAVEAEPPPLLRLIEEAVSIIETVEYAVEGRDSPSSGSE